MYWQLNFELWLSETFVITLFVKVVLEMQVILWLEGKLGPFVYAFQCLTGKFDNNNTIRFYPLGGLSRLDHQVWHLAGLRMACGSSLALE